MQIKLCITVAFSAGNSFRVSHQLNLSSFLEILMSEFNLANEQKKVPHTNALHDLFNTAEGKDSMHSKFFSCKMPLV